MKQIDIYVKDLTTGGESCCDCDCCAPSLSVSEIVDRFNEKYPSVGEFRLHVLGDEDKSDMIVNLNKAFKNSNERLVISTLNFDYIMSKIAPVIIVDDKVVSVKDCPDENELYTAIVTGRKIPVKPSCC